MKTINSTPIGNHLWVALKHSALALAVAFIASSGTARATNIIYNFASGYYPGPANADYDDGGEGFTPNVNGAWTAEGSLYGGRMYFNNSTRFELTADPGFTVTLQNFDFGAFNGDELASFTVLASNGSVLETVSGKIPGSMAGFNWSTLTDTKLTIVFGTSSPDNSWINNIKFSQQAAALNVALTSPVNNVAITSGNSVTASASVTEPGAFTHTVTFHVTPTSPSGPPVTMVDTNPPFTADFGAIALGTYSIYATVLNSNSETATSATRTFNVVPQTTTRTFNLGTSPAKTTIESGVSGLLPWIAKGSLPPGSILRRVTVNAKLEDFGTDGTDDDWASDLNVYLDPLPTAPGTAALLQVGGYGTIGTVGQQLKWANGDNGPGTMVIDTKLAAAWVASGAVDLNTVEVSIGNDYSQASWSGTITIEYDGSALGVSYATWATTNSVTGGVNGDSNDDGVQNGIAYFVNSSGLITNPGLTGNTVSWPNGGNIPAADYGTQFIVQTSPDLVTWASVLSSDVNLSDISGSVSYTLPSGADKLFVRLLVTPIP